MLYEPYKIYSKMGYDVMRAVPSLRWIPEADVRIGFMRSFKEKRHAGKAVMGECIKVNELYEAFCPYDFLIVIYEPNVVNLDRNQLQVLLWHELLHVGVSEKNGEPQYRIIPHDVEDFDEIVSRFGLHWADEGVMLPDIAVEGGG